MAEQLPWWENPATLTPPPDYDPDSPYYRGTRIPKLPVGNGPSDAMMMIFYTPEGGNPFNMNDTGKAEWLAKQRQQLPLFSLDD
jgi:hypothetical protein